jgi:hypothetical protein
MIDTQTLKKNEKNEHASLKAIVSYMVSDGNGGSAMGKLAIKEAPSALCDGKQNGQADTTNQDVISGNVLVSNTEDYRSTLFISSFAINEISYCSDTIATIPRVGKMQVLKNGTYLFFPEKSSDRLGPNFAFSVSECNNMTP